MVLPAFPNGYSACEIPVVVCSSGAQKVHFRMFYDAKNMHFDAFYGAKKIYLCKSCIFFRKMKG